MIELRRLLADEIAACRAYRRGFGQLAHETIRALTPLHREHRTAAGLLRNALAQRSAQGHLDTTSRWRMLGPNRGVLAGLSGPRAVVQWLRTGEANGVSHVRQVVRDTPADRVQALVAQRILPRLRNNLLILDQLLERAPHAATRTPREPRLYHA